MNETDLKVKQQIVEKIKSSTNILVTVSRDPSVDELSAALGLATLLNKIDKHATAIFSGTVPPAINFLDPSKVFENSADSLRDFIISLDKEKADHLRYKLEGDMVKIFITPYRTTITSDDLEFSQGDFNVELVLALGVENQEHLDRALEAHGRILHDVTVATFSAGEQISQLGSLDWRDDKASSLCEMVEGIADALKTDKTLLDKQIATALLTGIVAATDRFSNTRTTARVMTMAADLMAAGADQQLIAAKLNEAHEINSVSQTTVINTETEVPVEQTSTESVAETSTLPPDGDLSIEHGTDEIVQQVEESTIANSTLPESEPVTPDDTNTYADTTAPAEVSSLPAPEPIDYSTSTLADAYAFEQPTAPVQPEPFTPELPADEVTSLPHERVIEPLHGVTPEAVGGEPLLGGILNATTDMAAEDARRELEEQQNKTILQHSYLGNPETIITPNPINGIGQTEATENVDIFAGGPAQTAEPAIGLPLPPTVMPDFSTLPPPPLPDFNAPAPDAGQAAMPEQTSNDPSQFRIPGQ